MQIQSNLASTIAMAFDECPSSVADKKYMANSVARTTRWLKRCKAEMAGLNSLPDTINPQQLLFGINQGSTYEDIRVSHMKAIRELDLDMEKTNVNGGAIALGHPFGATGAILLTKIVYEMQRRDAQNGIVPSCIGGGQGFSVLLERE